MTVCIAKTERDVGGATRTLCRTCGRELASVTGTECPGCGGDANLTLSLVVTPGSSGEHSMGMLSGVVQLLDDTPAPGSPWGTPTSSGGVRVDEDAATQGLNRAERYEVIDTLGQGAMGLVLKVRDTALDEVMALKVLAPSVGLSELVIESFKQEVRIARRIHHPNVARIYDLFQWHGHMAISQEYISGRDLAALIERGPLPPQPVWTYASQICLGLQAAHDIGAVHRDLKGSNIRVDDHGFAKVLDFGLASLVDAVPDESSAWVRGTPTHMAPEQVSNPEGVDQRTDIYSLGIVLFSMATGRLPYAGSTPEIIQGHLHKPPPRPRDVNPDVPPGLNGVILRCLEKDPARRYQTATAVREELRKALGIASADEAAGRQKRTTRGRVLVVDDSREACTEVEAHLVDLKVQSSLAADGYQGVEAALREQPDVILLDVAMPVLDGREALRIIKSNPATATIPVVMMTGAGDREEETAFKEMGAAMCLAKPLNRDVLELLVYRFGRRRSDG